MPILRHTRKIEPVSDDVEPWFQYLARANRSPETIRTYRSVLASYPPPLTATLDDAETWWKSLDGLSPAARAKSLAAVRSFYRWAARYDIRPDDPTRRLDAPKLGTHMPRFISRTELATILAAVTPDIRRAVALGAYAGLRVSEAAALDWSDVDLDNRWITVRAGKGNKDRVVDAPPLLLDELLPNTGGNVVTAGGAPYTAGALDRKSNRAIRAAGVPHSFHRLRARFATVGYAATGNLLAMQRALGHASPTTTARYAATTDDDLRAIGSAVTRGVVGL